MRVFVAAASLAVILAASAGAAPPASGGGGKEKPSAITAKGQTLVVDANMKLAWDAAATTRGPGAAAELARRLLAQVPHRNGKPQAPDVVLLQEVIRPTNGDVRDALTSATGRRYRTAVHPPRKAHRGGGVKRETAVLYLARTVREVDGRPNGKQFIRTTCAWRICARPHESKDHATTLLEEKATGERLPVVSVHFSARRAFTDDAPKSKQFAIKGRWTRRLLDGLGRRFGHDVESGTAIVGGDFNNRRCVSRDETPLCEETPAYRRMQQAGYLDAVRTAAPLETLQAEKRIDFIWGRGAAVLAAGSDRSRKADGAMYSDHGFVWALLASR